MTGARPAVAIASLPAGAGGWRRLGAAVLALLGAGCAPADGRPAAPQVAASAAPAPPPSTPPAAADAAAAPGDAGSPDATAAEPEPPPLPASETADLLIRGGMVVDGSGRTARRAEVVVRGERIVHVGPVADGFHAAREIDARGKVVTPGFIDAHAHADPLGDVRPALAMGVTTLVVGQDGRSPGDASIADWARAVTKARPMINAATLVGHATVRTRAGAAAGAPSAAQLATMARLVGEGMDQGAFGLSTGLEYWPGRGAKLEELVEIARPVGARGGLVMSHLRSEDDDAIDGALDELVAQGRGAGARVHVAHIKVVYGKGVARAESLLARMAAARQAGVAVSADIYPYEASFTGIEIVFPDWAKGDWAAATGRRRAELADYLRKRITRRNGPGATLFGTGKWTGQTLAEVAAKLGKPFEDVLIDDIGPNGASAAYFVMDPALQARLLLDPHVVVGSDGGGGGRHPRGHGTFARVLREAVVEQKQLSLEAAVHKMSGATAQLLGLDAVDGAMKRGQVRSGWAADLLVFDPARVRDRATYREPHLLAEGFDVVLVAGRLVRDAGVFTAARPGQVLLRAQRP
jgi:N-acyl-D-aspartate/D-glutamate deacylase